MTTNKHFINLAQYFRRSIIDSERLSPNTQSLLDAIKPRKHSIVKRDAPFAIASNVWQSGELDSEITQAIFKILKVDKTTKQIEIVLMPRVDLIKVSAGKSVGQPSPIIAPIVAQLRLNRTGELQPSDKPPYVPRECLAPNQSDQIPFGKVSTMDEFIDQNPFNAANWTELTDYCDRMIASLLADKIINKKDELSPTLQDYELLDEYQIRQDISLVLLEPPIVAGFHILKIYDAILRGTELNQLFKKVFSIHSAAEKPYRDLTLDIEECKNHVGQMTAEFPLAEKQRNALHYVARMDEGDLLAVNGPPGTGKTTLLRSVVADSWVRAAILRKEPPIVVATSSSNQAVTNILDSFSKIEETNVEEALKGRWLPNINAYGLYACGDNKANKENPYSYVTKKGAGIMQAMESDVPIEEMKKHFLMSFNTWSIDNKVDDVKQAEDSLYKALCQCTQMQQNIQKQFLNTKQQLNICEKRYGSKENLYSQIEKLSSEKRKLECAIANNESLITEFLLQWQKRPWFAKLFSFIPAVKRQWSLNNEILARKLFLSINTLDAGLITDNIIRHTISTKSIALSTDLAELENEYITALSFQEQLEKDSLLLTDLLSNVSLDQKIETITYGDLVNRIDTQLRFRAFKLATHYWEARWINDASRMNSQPRTPAERIQAYRRYAKLTPCFVATFNMLPNFFEVSEKDGDGWKSTPMVDSVDLLIVDEAGQALPHVAAASFLVAKKALLVGDVNQIEPVWSLSKGVDKANLTLTNLINKQLDYESFWLDSEMIASSGNLMKVAQRQSHYCQFEDLEKGLFLTEHRRCYDSIVHYCNKLVYKGHLEPLRGESSKEQLFPSMGFVNHVSFSQRLGTSRINLIEAEFICKWIIENKQALACDNKLEKAVAIITPFKMQEKIIRQALNKHGLVGIKVGTVHVFQGAECDVVLFSSVYASNDGSGSKFYDRGSNMLNVAVSRAKNSFIVFGDANIFGADNSSSPSSLLKGLLTRFSTQKSVINHKQM